MSGHVLSCACPGSAAGGESHGRLRLQRLCFLAAGNSESLLETRLRLVCLRDSLPQPHAFESMLLHLVAMFPSFIRSDEHLSQRREDQQSRVHWLVASRLQARAVGPYGLKVCVEQLMAVLTQKHKKLPCLAGAYGSLLLF